MDWKAIGARIGRALADALPDAAREKIRDAFAARFGRCKVCEQPLAGESPCQICEGCHAGQVLAAGLGGDKGDCLPS